MNIPFSPPDITELEINAVAETLRSGWITTGAKTKLFEREIAAFCGTNAAVCLNSATAALELTLRILGVGPGDEVITSAYTYTASASVIAHTGAKIVLIDTAPGSFFMDIGRLQSAITERTKAVIAVDIAGVMCDYDALLAAVESQSRLFKPADGIQAALGRAAVIADAAHSFGAESWGVMSGAAADFTCFSFHAVKNLTTAEGGAVTWRSLGGISDREIYRDYMLLALHGQDRDAQAKLTPGAWEYDILQLGYKCNMPDTCAAMGLAQLHRQAEMSAKRRAITDVYDNAFRHSRIKFLPHAGEGYESARHLYLARITGADEERRNRAIMSLANSGIAANVHYKPLPMLTAYRNLGFDIRDFPNAYAMYQNEISLPLHTQLSCEDAEYVANALLQEASS